MLTVTNEAAEKIRAALAQQGNEKTAIRVDARSTGAPEFEYGMKLVGDEDQQDADIVVAAEGFSIFVDPASAPNLEGAEIDFEEGILRSGFKFNNPNKPASALGHGPRGDLTGATAERVEQLVNTEINSAVAAHGGVVNFLGVKDNKAFLSFGGGCHGCGMVDVTLKQGIEARIKELVPEIVEVVDVTDHATGENPYYS